MTIATLRSPSTSWSVISCCSWISLMMIRFNSIWTGTRGLAFPVAVWEPDVDYTAGRENGEAACGLRHQPATGQGRVGGHGPGPHVVHRPADRPGHRQRCQPAEDGHVL